MITDVDNVQTSKLKGYNANHKVQYSKFNTQSSKEKEFNAQRAKFKGKKGAYSLLSLTCLHFQCEDSVACKIAKH